MKMQMKKFGKISSIFEFSISKLGYVADFMKIWDNGLERVNAQWKKLTLFGRVGNLKFPNW